MPLRDHFHPVERRHGWWDAVLGMFPGVVAVALNQILPERYAAGPRIHINSLNDPFLIVPEDGPEIAAAGAPTLVAPDGWSNVDAYEVLIHDRGLCHELGAVILFVAPSNKNAPEHRRAFVANCGALLQRRVSLTVVDFVTEGSTSLYDELVELIGPSAANTTTKAPISAFTIRARPTQNGRKLEAWYHPLVIGQPLPTLPLWITEQLVLPLELELLYEQTLRALKMR